MATHAPPMSRATAKRLNAWLRGRAKPVRAALLGAVTAGSCGGLLLVAQAWALARIVDGVVTRHLGLAATWPWLWALLGIFAARALAGVASERLAFAAAAGAKQTLRRELHAKLASLGTSSVQGQASGALAALLTDGLDKLDQYYSAYLPQAALAMFIPAALLAFAFPADWVSGLIMLASAPLIPLFMVIVGKGAEQLNQRQWRRLARMSAHFFDVIEGLTTLKLFNASRIEARIVERMSDEYRHSVMAVLRVAFLSALVLEFFATLSIAMIAVYIGFRLYYGEMSLLPGFYVLLLAPEFYRPLRAMGTQHHARMEAVAAAEQIVALLETPAPERLSTQGKLPDARIRMISLEGVDFSYRSGQPVLRGIDLTLKQGERVALIGPSGGGKSTLARLLLGLATPDAGRIVVDGVDLRGIDPQGWFARVAWLPQAPTIFHGSIAENLRLAKPDATETELRAAAEAAGAAGFIERLPRGYDSLVGEHGQGLSGGEIRRLALARALLKDADLLILDEADASLDAAAAAAVNHAVATQTRDRAVLVIAHRLESVADADRIVVLADGRVVETGTPAELRARPGAYAAALAAYGGAA
ncbi:thiol reductant ABC exporter subunit CydD [Acidocella aromatica]|uniref:ATP-binding cassette subfamily C protein CydD n=1 Tax=Acidocella aromatica TaxID=1303579 RepID=A0A840VMH4_9PROT|nr:thiol reductant ABC exporter subunit CydD [Acidocella aromatica]MBB5373379.1 ATP-binding cassette subfamily C protein CydD [Acidocella aromatica]